MGTRLPPPATFCLHLSLTPFRLPPSLSPFLPLSLPIVGDDTSVFLCTLETGEELSVTAVYVHRFLMKLKVLNLIIADDFIKSETQ